MSNTLQPYNLFLDDYRIPEEAHQYMLNKIYLTYDWVVVENYDEFVDCVTKMGMPRCVSFDHDLSELDYSEQETPTYDDLLREKNGFHCAKWLIDYAIDNNVDIPEEIHYHSMNPVGRLNMKSLFETYKKAYNK
jgi:hypothetical protein